MENRIAANTYVREKKIAEKCFSINYKVKKLIQTCITVTMHAPGGRAAPGGQVNDKTSL